MLITIFLTTQPLALQSYKMNPTSTNTSSAICFQVQQAHCKPSPPLCPPSAQKISSFLPLIFVTKAVEYATHGAPYKPSLLYCFGVLPVTRLNALKNDCRLQKPTIMPMSSTV